MSEESLRRAVMDETDPQKGSGVGHGSRQIERVRLMDPEQRAGNASCFWRGPEVAALIEQDRADAIAKVGRLPRFHASEPRQEVVCGVTLSATPLDLVRLVDVVSLLEGR